MVHRSQFNYGNEWRDERPSRVVPVNTINKLYKNKSAFLYKIEYPPDVPGVTVIKLVSQLFADAVDS